MRWNVTRVLMCLVLVVSLLPLYFVIVSFTDVTTVVCLGDTIQTGAVTVDDDVTTPWRLHRYDDKVDLRLIVLTCNRPTSLHKLLKSLDVLILDGRNASLEIWIDRAAIGSKVDNRTWNIATQFHWSGGPTHVHVHPRHVGIYGQWLTTWRPRSDYDDEIALILEDDLTLSPYAYRWLRAARQFYADRRDIAGLTLQSESLIIATTGQPLPRPKRGNIGAAFLYQLIGTWGFVPQPGVWRRFQDWYMEDRLSNSGTRPYVDGLVLTNWYKIFESKNQTNTMWSMWFIYYSSEVEAPLYTIYNNLFTLRNGRKASCLAVNRREDGLHYTGKAQDKSSLLLKSWSDKYIHFHRDVTTLGFNARKPKS